MMVGHFVEVCRRGLNVNAGKSKVMVLNGEEGLECEVFKFKYLGYVLDESDTDKAECSRKEVSGKRVAGAIRSLFNAKNLQLECARVLHEILLVPVLVYGNEIMLWKEKRSSIRIVQMDKLRVGRRKD